MSSANRSEAIDSGRSDSPPAMLAFRKFDRVDLGFCAVMTVFTLLLLSIAALSLQWFVYWDAMHNQNVAFQVNERGCVLYRDIYDPNMFGTYLFHIIMSKIIGYGDLSWRIFDVAWLFALGFVTWKIMRRFDWRSAWFSVISFPWVYLNWGETQSFQRDILIVFPLSVIVYLCLTPSALGKTPKIKLLLIGALFGAAAGLKPQALIGLPWVAWHRPTADSEAPPFSIKMAAKGFILRSVFLTMGCALPILAGFLWLGVSGGLGAFLDMVTHYWPVYTQQIFDGAIVTAKPGERPRFVWLALSEFRNLGGRQVLIWPTCLLVAIALDSKVLQPSQKAAIRFLAGMAILYFLQVVIVGNFHPYSWMPFLYFVFLLISLSFFRPSPLQGIWTTLCVLGFMFWAMYIGFVQVSETFYRQITNKTWMPYTTGRGERMAEYLKSRLCPEDRVQVLDWLGGTERAMVSAGARTATPYLQDVMLYHAVRHPYVRELRSSFLKSLHENPPRFVILVTEGRLRIVDRGDDGIFQSDLSRLLEDNYAVAVEGDGYKIYEVKKTNSGEKAPKDPAKPAL